MHFMCSSQSKICLSLAALKPNPATLKLEISCVTDFLMEFWLQSRCRAVANIFKEGPSRLSEYTCLVSYQFSTFNLSKFLTKLYVS